MPQLTPSQFTGIFVSYRREDTAGHAGRLFDKLVNHFGKDRIFMDIDTIEPGEDFVTVIENAVGSCEILIAMIGRNWLSKSGESTRLLDNPNDFVRIEIATALKRDIRVIPVLVQRATMPNTQDLPDDLVKFSRRNALELSDQRWHLEVEQLIGVMERILTKREDALRLAGVARRIAAEGERQEADEKRRGDEETGLRVAAEEQAKLHLEVLKDKATSDRDRVHATEQPEISDDDFSELQKRIQKDLKGFNDPYLLVGKDIPLEKRLSAINAYANHVKPQDVLLLYDNPGLTSAVAGIILTPDAVYWCSHGSKPGQLRYSEIRSVNSRKGGSVWLFGKGAKLLINENEIELIGGEDRDQIAESLANVIRQLTRRWTGLAI